MRPPGWGISLASTVKPSTSNDPSSRAWNDQRPLEAAGVDREERRAPSARRARRRRHRSATGRWTSTRASGRSPAVKNGMPWVWSQCRWPSSSAPSNGASPSSSRDAAQPGAAVDQQPRAPLVVVGDGDARRVPADADERRAGRRGRAANPAQVQAHRAVLARSTGAAPRGGGHRQAPQAGPGRRRRTAQRRRGIGVRARSVDVRAPALEQRPLPDHRAGADLGHARRRRPRRRARRRAAGTARRRWLPCSVSVSPAFSLRIVGFGAPRMIDVDSSRSSAVSTSVTSAGESSSPHGVCVAEGRAGPVLVVDQAALGGERAVVVVDPVAGERRCPDEAPSLLPSAWMVSSSVVHTIGAQYCTNGGRRTARGAWEPGPPTGRLGEAHPAVADARARSCRSGRLTAATVNCLPSFDRRRPDRSAADVAGVDDGPVVVELDATPRGGWRSGSGRRRGAVRRRDDIGTDDVGRGLVVVGEADLEDALGDARDRLRGDPRDARDRAGRCA